MGHGAVWTGHLVVLARDITPNAPALPQTLDCTTRLGDSLSANSTLPRLAREAWRDERPLYLTAAMTGIRQGELIALPWLEVDWVARRIRVADNIPRGRTDQADTPKLTRGGRCQWRTAWPPSWSGTSNARASAATPTSSSAPNGQATRSIEAAQAFRQDPAAGRRQGDQLPRAAAHVRHPARCGWRPKGRWFKSSRPDHKKPPQMRRFRRSRERRREARGVQLLYV